MDNPAITNTFIAFLLLSMNLGIKEYFRSVKNQRETEELRQQHLEQELEYLRYQINPHFFMNTLNNIHALVDIDPEQAKNTILELSRLMRYLLYDGSRPTIPLVKETEFLRHYIALMRLRYTDSVRIEVDIPDESETPEVQVPPLLFISFVENAFKHGISYQSESFIMVSLNVREGFINFSCINSKHERNQDPHSGIGLENTQKRLKLLYHDDYTFNINENAKTYEVLLKIPVTYD
jgi:LytS/YehU family sensor histidine kinase